MYYPIVAWLMFLTMIVMMGLLLDNVSMMATHSFVQAATDAAADAGANQRMLIIGSSDVHEFVIDPITARTAAQATFDKNLMNMELLNMNVSNIETPTYSFPDAYTIGVSVDLTQEMKYSENVLQYTLGSTPIMEPIEASVEAFSDINHRREFQ